PGAAAARRSRPGSAAATAVRVRSGRSSTWRFPGKAPRWGGRVCQRNRMPFGVGRSHPDRARRLNPGMPSGIEPATRERAMTRTVLILLFGLAFAAWLTWVWIPIWPFELAWGLGEGLAGLGGGLIAAGFAIVGAV